MPKKKRVSALYKRGSEERGEVEYRLDWDRKRDGSLRSPYLAVFWYDSERGGGRSASTGTTDVEEGKRWLDAFYLGRRVCPTCHRPFDKQSAGGQLVTAAVEAYLTLHAKDLKSESAVRSRLSHVIEYLAASHQLGATCEQIDDAWVRKFRKWSGRQPIVSQNGKVLRDRSIATTETSVVQLAAAISHAKLRPNFKPLVLRDLNNTPQHRSSVAELAAMFRYCLYPDVMAEVGKPFGRSPEPATEETLVQLRRQERSSLHRFLIVAVATLGRPDAIYDIGLDPKRKQWNSNARILSLNPAHRHQTKKYRAIVPVASQAAPWLDAKLQEWQRAKAEAEKARRKPPAAPFFVGVKSVRKAWERMASEIGLPIDREAGQKLIRRSMADLVRSRLPAEAVAELSMFMGHDKTDSITSLYAPFSPDYLRRALSVIEGIIDEIETLCPGAFSRTIAGAGAEVVPIRRRVNA